MELFGYFSSAHVHNFAAIIAKTGCDDQKWQPIETAPKDDRLMGGSRILGWAADWAMPFVVKYSPHRPFPHWTVDSGAVIESAPTHWMPLPPPPVLSRLQPTLGRQT